MEENQTTVETTPATETTLPVVGKVSTTQIVCMLIGAVLGFVIAHRGKKSTMVKILFAVVGAAVGYFACKLFKK